MNEWVIAFHGTLTGLEYCIVFFLCFMDLDRIVWYYCGVLCTSSRNWINMYSFKYRPPIVP